MYFTCYDLSEISSYGIGVKQANIQTDSYIKFNDKIKTLKFKIKWQVKTNHEIIKHINFIP